MLVKLASGDAAGFRTVMSQLVASQVEPESVEWSQLVAEPGPGRQARARSTSAAAAIIPRAFLRLTDLVVLHKDAGRFDLLYRLLWRIIREPGLKDDPSDPDMVRATRMAQAVRRDLYRLRGALRFEAVTHEGHEIACAWTEPVHRLTESLGLWCAQKDPRRHFVLASWEMTLEGAHGQLHYHGALPAEPQGDDAWQACLHGLHAQQALQTR
jgi:probable DNA metabolism protein